MKLFLVMLVGLMSSLSAMAVNPPTRAFPSRAVTIIVPASAGTGADIVARLLSQRLSEVWGQAVTVVNRDGASGNIGAAAVAKSAPDGYTLCMAFLNHAISPSLYSNLQYDIVKDFKPIVRTSIAPMVIVANPNFPANTIPELIALAKARTAGNEIFFGSPGMGSVNGLSLEMLKQKASISMTQTPFKGNAQMMTDIMGNQIPLGAIVIAAALPHIKSGKLKALGVTSKSRSLSLPYVATVEEAGISGFDVSAWNGLLAPANTPDTIINEIYSAAVKIIESQSFKDKLIGQGLEPAALNPAQFREYISKEVTQWGKVVNESGVKVD